jgi:fructose-1,6-bisphosphatase
MRVTGEPAQVFEDFRVEDRGADLIDAHGPFAEIDLAAPVRAEREVFVFHLHEHTAGGAVEELYGFFL